MARVHLLFSLICYNIVYYNFIFFGSRIENA